MKQESVSPRGAVDSISTAPRVLSFARLAKSKTFKALTSLMVLVALVGIARWAWQDDTPDAPVGDNAPPIEIDNLKSFLARQDGKKWWEISAKEVSLAPNGDFTTITSVKKGIFYKDDQPFLTLQSPIVRLSNRTNNVAATGGVHISGPNGFTIQTAQTYWINRTKTIECAKPVTATLRGMTFSAPRMTYNWKDGILSCPQPVEVKATGAVLKAKHFQVNTQSRVLDLGGGAEFVFSPKKVDRDQFKGLIVQ